MKNLGVLFPGQGSQSVGMLSAMADSYPDITHTFAEASELLGYDLWDLAKHGPEERQRDTRVTQALMFASGVALWRVWQAQTGQGAAAAGAAMQPAVMAGHSLGEFVALTAAGSLSFADAVGLVNQRAHLMAAAVPAGQGGMAAVLGLDDEAVVSACQSVAAEVAAEVGAEVGAGRVLEAVNFNAPGQVAISGHVDALQAMVAKARDYGARKAVMLPVSVPNHSSLMHAAGDELAAAIDALDWQMATVPVVQNSTAATASTVEQMLDALRPHVYSPVHWVRSVTTMISDFSVSAFVELGPGKVLTGLGKRIDKSVPVYAIESPESLDAALEALSGAAA